MFGTGEPEATLMLRAGLTLSLLVMASTGGVQQLDAKSANAGSAPPWNSAAILPISYWRTAAREDVTAAYLTMSRHHPGMFDPKNLGFPRQLRRARDKALKFADTVEDAEGHMRALALFSAGLADGHARAQAAYSGRGELLWPGFRTVWRGKALHVADSIENNPARGSVLLGCDGKNARSIIREVAFSLHGRPSEAGQWWTNAPAVFLGVRSRYRTLPVECSFTDPHGRTTSYRLDWRPVPVTVMRGWFEAEAPREPIGLTEPRFGMHLISLPSFSPDEAGRAAYRRLFEELQSGVERLATGRAIVIDLRKNQGGSWSWSREVASRLWGDAAVTSTLAKYFRDTEIWWLADSKNIAHFRGIVPLLRSEGRAEDAGEIERLVGNLVKAAAGGRRFYVQQYGSELAAKTKGEPPRQLPPVYVLVDGGCASACLDAVDLFTQFKGVKLVGAPTSADSNYMEIRVEQLPSQRGIVILPTKIWVRRPRGSGEVYRPHVLVTDLDWTTAAMLDHVERDLTDR